MDPLGVGGPVLKPPTPSLLLTPGRVSGEDKVRNGVGQAGETVCEPNREVKEGRWTGASQPDRAAAEEHDPFQPLVVEEVVEGPEAAIFPEGI